MAFHNLGVSSRTVAKELGVSCTTVLKWIKREEETGILTDLSMNLMFVFE